MKEGNSCTVQQRWAPVSILLLGIDELQHHMETAPHTKAEFLQRGQVGIPSSKRALPKRPPPASPKEQADLGAIAAVLHLQIQKELDETWLRLYRNGKELQDHDFDTHVLNLALKAGQEGITDGGCITTQASIH